MAKAMRKRKDNVVPMAAVEQEPETVRQSEDVTDSDIARRAFDLCVARGGAHGHDLEDWLQAERELRPALSSTAA